MDGAIDRVLAEATDCEAEGLDTATVSLRAIDLPISVPLDTAAPHVVRALQEAGYAVIATNITADSNVATFTVRFAHATNPAPESAPSFLPDGAIDRLERFGRHEFNSGTPDGSSEDPDELWMHVVVPLRDRARSDPAAFLAEIAVLVVEHGGFAAVGAASLVYDWVPQDLWSGSDYESIMRGAVTFLHDNDVPSIYVGQYLLDYWTKQNGRPW